MISDSVKGKNLVFLRQRSVQIRHFGWAAYKMAVHDKLAFKNASFLDFAPGQSKLKRLYDDSAKG